MADESPPLVLYPFRFFDPVRGRWIQARYRATREEIVARYERREIVGEPEIRHVASGSFNPFRSQ